MEDIRLYILMRTDIPTMNPGKAVAQGSHAANQCIYEARQLAADYPVSLDDDAVTLGLETLPDAGIAAKAHALETMVNQWEDQSGHGFGTCIVVGVNESTMRERVSRAQQAGVHAGITHDPSYPLGMPPLPTVELYLAMTGIFSVLLLWSGKPIAALVFAVLLTFVWISDLVGKVRRDREPKVIPLDTCAYIFGTAEECRPFVGDLYLMR